MSAPTSDFSKLSLSHQMHSSRGTSRGSYAGKGKARAPDPPSSDDDEALSDAERQSSPDEAPEAPGESQEIVSYGRVFAFDHCRQHGQVYAFQIADAEVERYSIRISSANGTRPQCTCDATGNCRHVNWLLRQLEQASDDYDAAIAPYEWIAGIGLVNVCEKLRWEMREGTDSDSEETQWLLKKDESTAELQRQTRGMVRERMKEVRDIMATLSETVTDDYRPDIFGLDEITPDRDIFVPRDLQATVSRLLILNDDILKQFRSLVSRNARAVDYFQKMEMKARNTCLLLDQYEEEGPVSGEHDIKWCGQTLVNIVNAISLNITERQPLSPSSREVAAKALISILAMVVKDRNYDAYQNIKWVRQRIHAEPRVDRNLYQRLIGTTSNVNPSGGTFVIKALRDLPEASRFVEDLEEIHAILSTIGWGPAPQAFRDKLSAIIGQLKGSAPQAVGSSSGSGRGGPSASAGKRSAGTVDRKAKRMK